jgi:hypothetical protein
VEIAIFKLTVLLKIQNFFIPGSIGCKYTPPVRTVYKAEIHRCCAHQEVKPLSVNSAWSYSFVYPRKPGIQLQVLG